MKLHLLLSWMCLIILFVLPQQAHAQSFACKGKTGCETPGAVCPDGTVFAGCPATSYRPIYTTRCDSGRGWTGSACTNTQGWAQISAGDESSCGVKVDGSGYCWGSDGTLQAGNGATTGNQHVPSALSGGGPWLSANAGFESACGLKSNGAAWCWGEGQYGVIGNGSTTDQNAPTAVSGGHIFKMLAMGNSSLHACAIRASDSALYCWGYNGEGGIGDNSNTHRSTPTAVNGGGTWKYIATGFGNTCGIKTDDSLWCWGRNAFGAVGDNSQIDRWVPTAINGGGTWKRVSIGYEHSCGIKSDDTAWCWGYRANGEIGDGTNGTRVLVPTAVSGGHKWKEISAGTWSSCGIRTDGVLMCWGDNIAGQLGINSTTATNIPTAVNGGGTWRTISLNWRAACGIKMDDTGYCWGYNGPGRVGDNTSGTDRLVPTAVDGPAGSSVQLPYNNGNSTGTTSVPATVSFTDGVGNTAALVAADSDSGVGGTQPHQAAAYCDSFMAGGYSDWYLPSAAEIQTMSVHRDAAGNFNSDPYWTSTGSSNNAGATNLVYMLTLYEPKQTARAIRCARKD